MGGARKSDTNCTRNYPLKAVSSLSSVSLVNIENNYSCYFGAIGIIQCCKDLYQN